MAKDSTNGGTKLTDERRRETETSTAQAEAAGLVRDSSRVFSDMAQIASREAWRPWVSPPQW
jgi:hypothetical protein